MAIWSGKAKTNLFKIKGDKEYTNFCEKWGCKDSGENEKLGKNRRYIIFEEGILHTLDMYAKHGCPSADDFLYDLANQLADESVAIVYEIGGEGWHFFTGEGMAINSKREHRRVWLGDIDKLAKELGKVEYMI